MLVGLDAKAFVCLDCDLQSFDFQLEAIDALKGKLRKGAQLPKAIINASGKDLPAYNELIGYLQGLDQNIPLIVYDDQYNEKRARQSKDYGATDYLSENCSTGAVALRLSAILSSHEERSTTPETKTFKTPLIKRLFDIAISSVLLLLLSPLFITLIIVIRLESKGKAFYYQPRVGTGYRIFNFYKFRSMRVNADKEVEQMKSQNQYQSTTSPVIKSQEGQGPILIGNDQLLPEADYQVELENAEKNTFFKVKDDPRITKVGKFIRNTSIDELPQLFNVLIGDMSIVGNRPLPLYEAEKLTSDNWSKRFLAPAGITGLWQVTERGKESTSSDSRKALDVTYAENYSFWLDLKILLKTPLAALQHENV